MCPPAPFHAYAMLWFLDNIFVDVFTAVAGVEEMVTKKWYEMARRQLENPHVVDLSSNGTAVEWEQKGDLSCGKVPDAKRDAYRQPHQYLLEAWMRGRPWS